MGWLVLTRVGPPRVGDGERAEEAFSSPFADGASPFPGTHPGGEGCKHRKLLALSLLRLDDNLAITVPKSGGCTSRRGHVGLCQLRSLALTSPLPCWLGWPEAA